MASITINLGPGGQQGSGSQGHQQGPPGGFQQGPPGGFQQGPPGGFQQGPPGGFQQGPGYQQSPGYQQGPGYQQQHQQQMMPPGQNFQQGGNPNQGAPQQKPEGNQLYNVDGFTRLENLEGIFVSQKTDYLEALSGCEQPNQYSIYRLNKNQEKKGKRLFKCKENSGCCARLCLSGECRPFQVTIDHCTLEGGNDEYDDTPFLAVDRECKCTFYCFGRPEMKVYDSRGKSKEEAIDMKNYIGKILDPFNCCNLVVNVYDSDGDLQYIINGSCCQLGIWCKFPCEPCETITFEVQNKQNDKIGECIKKSKGCVQSAITDADNFIMMFPETQKTTKEMRALLMCAVIFLDFRFFEENPNNKKRDGNVVIVGSDD
mmetsp:Transcript_15944/g.13502  ORF Transcript_15944/g.13502 Transcript_15944/m.13502 type:complete len:372 (+) Transcript_15944:198-1313(+)